MPRTLPLLTVLIPLASLAGALPEARAQGSFLIFAPPGQYSEDPTGLRHPEVFYEKYWDPPPTAALGFGMATATSGTFNDVVDNAFTVRLSGLKPMMRQPAYLGALELGLIGSFEYSNWSARSGVVGVDREDESRAFRLRNLETAVFGAGPDARFYFHPDEAGRRWFLGGNFEGIAGWALADADRVAPPPPGGSRYDVSGGFNPDSNRSVWGLRAGGTMGVVLANEVSLTTNLGHGMFRSRVVDGIQSNSNFFYWNLNVGLPTDVLYEAAGYAWYKLTSW